ncbi:MAG: hypothetical protein GAK43_02258 [Stenotrophomonas maltophilia]|nr:MAG: hypothetical protein GAK43_02258 [Stenotrophomonas maltophilia]
MTAALASFAQPFAESLPEPAWLREPPDAPIDARLYLRAEAEVDLLCRLLNLMAVQGFLPERLEVQRESEELHIHLQLRGLPGHRLQVLAERLRAMVAVSEVSLQPAEA